MDLALIDIAFRGAVTGICVVLVALIWMSRIARESQLAFTLLILASTAKIWSAIPEIDGLADQLLRTIGFAGAFAMTWFALTIFLDDRRFAWIWLASAALITIGILLVPYAADITPFLRGFAVIHFIGLLGLVLNSAKGDLLDARRRMRPAMSAFLLLYSVGQAITSTPYKDFTSDKIALSQSGFFLMLLVIFGLWALKANINNWPGKTNPRPEAEPTLLERSTEQNALVRRINVAMSEGIWQIEGLTVAALAQKVNAPEHQVRKAINQVLGHRNFASFINGARIEAAKARLQAPEATETTIIAIAYDVGFSSLGPFNRAFRDATGQSPTDFRKQAIS